LYALLLVTLLAAVIPQQNYSQHVAASETGLTLPVRYYHPAAAGAPLIVIVHGWSDSQDYWEGVADKFQGLGFGVVLFNLRGHGGSTRAYYYFTGEQIAAMKEDVALALAFARGRAGGEIHLLGADLGASLAIIAAAEEGGVDKVVAVSPGLSYRGLDIRASVGKLGLAKLLLIASQEDVYSVYSIRQLERSAGGEAQSRILNNAGHGVWVLLRQPTTIEMIARWLVRSPQP
jgi:alpha-beta hydrolase superfamily lysophospholipase